VSRHHSACPSLVGLEWWALTKGGYRQAESYRDKTPHRVVTKLTLGWPCLYDLLSSTCVLCTSYQLVLSSNWLRLALCFTVQVGFHFVVLFYWFYASISMLCASCYVSCQRHCTWWMPCEWTCVCVCVCMISVCVQLVNECVCVCVYDICLCPACVDTTQLWHSCNYSWSRPARWSSVGFRCHSGNTSITHYTHTLLLLLLLSAVSSREVMQSPRSICFHSKCWTQWPLILTFWRCMDHDRSSRGTEGQGQGLSLKYGQWDLNPQSRTVF